MTASGPLHGIRVLDFSIAAAGPYAAAVLADQGADVVKVERPGIGDIGRHVGVAVNGMSALFQACNRGKRSIVLDLNSETGRDLARRLGHGADVVLENFKPGVMDRLGVGYDDLRVDHDDLVYVSVNGFGPEGPYAGKGAYDTVIQAYGGFATSQADNETGEPRFLQQTAADKVTALTAVQAITAALLARERGAGGQHVQVAMLDAVVSFLWVDAAGNEMLLDADGSQPSSFVQSFRPLRYVDGWGIATPTSDADFAGMCRAFGVDGYDDPRVATIGERARHRDLTRQIMDRCYSAAAKLTTAEAMQRLEANNVPCGVIVSPAGLSADPHARAVGLLEDSSHPVVGRVRQPRHPARFGITPAAVGAPAPALGEHTDAILTELGVAPAEIERLRAGGVVA